MMQRKKLKSLAMFFTAVSASFFIPLVVNADEAKAITATECSAGCKGHDIVGEGSTSENPKDKRIQVSGGTHKIKLTNVHIKNVAETDVYSAFDITGGATVELTLEGTNTLTSPAGCAGLHVPSGCSLTIKGTGSLTATGGNNGAGIGSAGIDGASGEVTIATTGANSKIIANGGAAAAGIGGGQGGGCGKVTINSGIVEAYGGPGYSVKDKATGVEIQIDGGTGIGTGGGKSGGGDLVLRGGQVTAIGGMSDSNTQRNGVDCTKLLSDNGSANLYSNSPISPSTNIDQFNGIVWLMQKENDTAPYKEISGSVYGKNAILDRDIKNISINIRQGCSLTIPSNKQITISGSGVISGDKSTSIINADNLIVAGMIILSADIQKKVTLSDKDIVTRGSNLTYNGSILDYTGAAPEKEAYGIRSTRADNGMEYIVDTTGWIPSYQRNSNPADHIQEAGDYRVIYNNTNTSANYKSFSFRVIVDKANLKDVKIAAIDNAIYNGKPQEPKLTGKVTFNNIEVKEGVDYQTLTPSSYKDNNKVGTATVTLTASANGNFIGEVTKTFEIKKAALSEANVSISSESATYNGQKQEPTITVRLDSGATLTKDTDYTVTSSSNDFVSANSDNPIVFTVKGSGDYGGTITKTYTINKKELSIASLTAEDRQYDGTSAVTIKAAEYTGLVPGDQASEVLLESKGIIESANVKDGGYATVKFDEFKLGGEKGKNYTITSPTKTDMDLSAPVNISQADAPEKPSLGGSYAISGTAEGRFVHTVEVTNPKPGAVYEYRMNDKTGETADSVSTPTAWQDSPVFDNIEPKSTHTFEAQSKLDPNVKQSEIGGKAVEFVLLKETRKPGDFQFAFSPNRDEQTFTGKISSNSDLGAVEYAICKTGTEPTDADYGSTDEAKTKKDCESNTSYTAYVRFRETGTHQPGPPNTKEAKTSRLVAKAPVIIPEDGSGFTEPQEVTITDKTVGGSTIHYTLDDTPPTLESPIYDGPFIIEETTTIRAYSVKDNMDDSEKVKATLTRELLDVEAPIIEPADGTEFSGSKLVEITTNTEEAVIHYTTDGTDPTVESKKYTEPFRISETTVVKAFAVKPDMKDSAITTATLNKIESTIKVHAFLNPFATMGDEIENNPISDELMSKLGSENKTAATESIYNALTQELSVLGNNGDFTYLNMDFYDLLLKVKIDSDPLRDATLDDFVEGGYTITVPYPEGTSLEAYDFAIAHMIASGEKTGNVETWHADTITKTPYGLQFNITSTSPIAIAWTPAVPNGPNSNQVGDGTNVVDPNNPDGNNPGGTGSNGTNPDGSTNGNGIATTNPKAGTAATGGSTTTSKPSLLPKTGDTSKIIVWILAAAAAAGVIAGIKIKSKKSDEPKKKH